MALTNNKINVQQITDYAKCPNYCKFNWDTSVKAKTSSEKIRSVIRSCYRDQSNLDKKTTWKTIRGRVHTELAPLLLEVKLGEYHRIAVKILDNLRTWYLGQYRDKADECLYGLRLSKKIPGINLEVEDDIEAILVEEEKVILVDIVLADVAGIDLFKDIKYKTKVWLLSQENVIVTNLLIISVYNEEIRVFQFKIEDPKDYIYRAEKMLRLIGGGIKYDIYYPSVTDMCTKCPYRRICS